MGAAAWMAFSPTQDRAECERRPVVRTSARRLPLQPPSMPAAVGSPRIARSPCSSCGCDWDSRFSPLTLSATSSWSYQIQVTSTTGSVSSTASFSCTATPAFMSTVPRPHSTGSPATSIVRTGRLSFSGTVSMWPAITTRLSRSSVVLATIVSPKRSTVRWG